MVVHPSVNRFSPNYTVEFPFEKNFQHTWTKQWMINYWHTSFYAVAIYLVVIFGGQLIMKNRQAFRLKLLLTVWNTSLAVFSIIGAFRTVPELVHVLNHLGFDHSVCHPSFIENVGPSGFWTWLFALSKVPELGDTVFIVLRKQKLIFLHWYHHITVLLFTWFTYSEYTASARWFVDINYSVHALMYSYYALKSLGFRIPPQMAMVITMSQTAQMVVGAYVIWHAHNLKIKGNPCNITLATTVFGLVMYLSYFVLFAHFFYKSYFSSSGNKRLTAGGSQKKGSKRD